VKVSVDEHFDELRRLLGSVEITDRNGTVLDRDEAFERASSQARGVTGGGGKLIFIGNGGSAGIASHMAVDFSNSGRMRAITLSDGAALTCLSNDYGYEQAFAVQIEWHARPGDLLVAISSSGSSPNILNGVEKARASGCAVISFSGFGRDNPLRCLGDLNFYVASERYGFVEIAHAALCHAILDFACAGERNEA
jgi:D-sedoheptulose 7-phosphate isomerase